MTLGDFERVANELIRVKEENKELKSRINKALNKINNMFDRGDGNTIIDDLLELEDILVGKRLNETEQN